MAGRVPLMFDVWLSAKRYVVNGDVKLIAGIGVDRLKDQPSVPTIAETYPGFDIVASQALVGPAGMPKPIVDKLSADIKSVITSPEFAEKSAPLGIEPRPMSRTSSVRGSRPRSRVGATLRPRRTSRWSESAVAAAIRPRLARATIT